MISPNIFAILCQLSLVKLVCRPSRYSFLIKWAVAVSSSVTSSSRGGHHLLWILQLSDESRDSIHFKLGFLMGQDIELFGTKGQQDKLKILPQDRTIRDSLSKSGTGRGIGQSLFFCQNLGQDAGQDGPTLNFFLWFSVLEHLFLF